MGLHTMLLYHVMLIAGLPYCFQGQMRMNEVVGGAPYGDGSHQVSATELEGARFLDRDVAQIAAKLPPDLRRPTRR